jgi:hypothetical protein
VPVAADDVSVAVSEPVALSEVVVSLVSEVSVFVDALESSEEDEPVFRVSEPPQASRENATQRARTRNNTMRGSFLVASKMPSKARGQRIIDPIRDGVVLA